MLVQPTLPNVLYLMADDMRPELGCYGQTHMKTPHLDRLSAVRMRLDCQTRRKIRWLLTCGCEPRVAGRHDLRPRLHAVRRLLPEPVVIPHGALARYHDGVD